MHLATTLGLPALAITALVTLGSPQTGTGAAPAARPAAPAAATAAAATYTIDGVHSCALFRVQHLGAGQFWGRFNDVSGTFVGGTPSGEGLSFDISVKVDSVDTRTKKLDEHLKSPDFFNAVEFPTMTFKSTAAKPAGNGMFDITGDFSMHGVTKPITARVEFTGARSNPAAMGGDRAGYEATFTIKRSDWGMNYGVDQNMLGNDVRITVNLEGTKK